MSTSTRNRVPSHTSECINQEILKATRRNIDYYRNHPQGITVRLNELDQEYDIERMLEVNSSAVSLFGLIMGLTVSKKWFLLPLTVQVFFLQHALQGWCPPLPVLRRLGFRTSDEINYERYALKLLRGDFVGLERESSIYQTDPEEILNAMIH